MSRRLREKRAKRHEEVMDRFGLRPRLVGSLADLIQEKDESDEQEAQR